MHATAYKKSLEEWKMKQLSDEDLLYARSELGTLVYHL